MVAGVASILGLSIEQKLERAAQGSLGLGLSKSDVAKAVAPPPPISCVKLHVKLQLLEALLWAHWSSLVGVLVPVSCLTS